LTAHARSSGYESEPPYQVDDRTKLAIPLPWIVVIIGAVISLTAAAVVGWMSVKSDIATHATQLVQVQKTLTEDHDLGVAHTAQIDGLAKTLNRIEYKLDRIPRVPETITTTTKTETVHQPP